MKIKSFFLRWVLRLFGARIFSNILLQCEGSPTYALFCEKVYGRNLCQANMVDEVQLQKLIEIAELKEEDSVLDLGCGSGGLTEFLSDCSRAHILGVDYAAKAIGLAQKRTFQKLDRLQFQVQNLNSLSLQHKSFDCIISVDTLYFVNDLSETLQQIKAMLKPNGKFLIFYSSKNREGESDLARVLRQLGFEFVAWDFTVSEKAVWERTLLYAEHLKEAFKREGNLQIYKGRIHEAVRNIQWQNEGLMTRYLYLATLK